jgi:hypothetical protein
VTPAATKTTTKMSASAAEVTTSAAAMSSAATTADFSREALGCVFRRSGSRRIAQRQGLRPVHRRADQQQSSNSKKTKHLVHAVNSLGVLWGRKLLPTMTAMITRTPAVMTMIAATTAPADIRRHAFGCIFGGMGNAWICKRDGVCLSDRCSDGDQSGDCSKSENFPDVHELFSPFVSQCKCNWLGGALFHPGFGMATLFTKLEATT